MNRSEAQELISKHLNSQLINLGFSSHKAERADLNFRRKIVLGYDGYYCSTYDYNPVQIITDYYYKRLDAVEEIIFNLQENIKTNPPIKKDDWTITFGYRSLNNIKSSVYLPEMQTEDDVIRSVGMIKEFMENTALPLLERFNDLREIDKEINGETPWETDWNKPFNLGGNFNFKRLIIARLANNPHYDELIEKVYQKYEKMALEQQQPFPGRDNMQWPIAYTINYLKNINSLY